MEILSPKKFSQLSSEEQKNIPPPPPPATAPKQTGKKSKTAKSSGKRSRTKIRRVNC
jgi:hypothetical protein